MLIEEGKSHHRPRLTLNFSGRNNLLNSTVIFLDPPVQSPTTSFTRLRWPHGKIEEVQLDWLGHDTVCYQTLEIIYPQYVRGKFKNITIKMIDAERWVSKKLKLHSLVLKGSFFQIKY